jgi:hypothetical protein
MGEVLKRPLVIRDLIELATYIAALLEEDLSEDE